MSKVKEATIVPPKAKAYVVKVGQEMVHKSNDTDIRTITEIDVTPNATYITLKNAEDVATTYGSLIVHNNFKLKDK